MLNIEPNPYPIMLIYSSTVLFIVTSFTIFSNDSDYYKIKKKAAQKT